jgi:hypothetical protein
MKKSYLYISISLIGLAALIVLVTCTSCAPAYGFDIGIEYTKQVPESDNFGDFDGLKIIGSKLDFPLYLWLSGEHGRLTLAGQQFTYVDLIGVGLGIQKRFDGFMIFADVGWYEPLCNFNGKSFKHGEPGYDRLWLHLNDKYGYISGVQDFDYYKMNISGNFGGTFGVKFFYRMFYGLLGYRVLSLPLIVEAWGNVNGWEWNRFENENLSGPFVGVGFSF